MAPGRLIICCPFKPRFFKIFGLGLSWPKFLGDSPESRIIFGDISFVGKVSFFSPIILAIP